jgi:hypothetical protein
MTLLIIIHLVGPIWEWPMTGMVECNVMAAGLECSDRLLYCINVGPVIRLALLTTHYSSVL